MSNISFKAKVYGLPLEVTAKQFEWRTENDTKHELTLLDEKSAEGKDTFVLSKNGKTTVSYQPEFSPRNSKLYDIDSLIHIFKTMKVLEAREVVKQNLEAKKSKVKQAEFDSIDNESL